MADCFRSILEFEHSVLCGLRLVIASALMIELHSELLGKSWGTNLTSSFGYLRFSFLRA